MSIHLREKINSKKTLCNKEIKPGVTVSVTLSALDKQGFVAENSALCDTCKNASTKPIREWKK